MISHVINTLCKMIKNIYTTEIHKILYTDENITIFLTYVIPKYKFHSYMSKKVCQGICVLIDETKYTGNLCHLFSIFNHYSSDKLCYTFDNNISLCIWKSNNNIFFDLYINHNLVREGKIDSIIYKIFSRVENANELNKIAELMK